MAPPLKSLKDLIDSDSVKEQKILEASAEKLAFIDFDAPEVSLKYGEGPVPDAKHSDKVFFFDIDNCLYQRSTKILDLMQIYIHRYFKTHLNLTDQEAHQLHTEYYKTYGLAIEGLVRHHKIDALEYNKLVDDAIPLEKILQPNLKLRNMLLRLKKAGKIDRLWLFTNAYKNHAFRVIKLLGLGDLFDGVTYCDYAQFPIVCKPMAASFDIALKSAGCLRENAYFVDDSELNVNAADEFGWGKVMHYREYPEEVSKEGKKAIVIQSLMDIEKVASELF